MGTDKTNVRRDEYRKCQDMDKLAFTSSVRRQRPIGRSERLECKVIIGQAERDK